MKVILLTSSGELVHKTDIPEFNPKPDVIGWGDRVFTYSHDELVGTPKVRGHYYKEAFAYAIVEPKKTTTSAPAKKSIETKPAEKPAEKLAESSAPEA